MFKYLRLRTRIESPINFKIKFNAIKRFPKSIGLPKRVGFKFKRKTVKIKPYKKGKRFKNIRLISVNRAYGKIQKPKKIQKVKAKINFGGLLAIFIALLVSLKSCVSLKQIEALV